MLRLVFICLIAGNSYNVRAARVPPTIAKEQDSKLENDVFFRILRNVKHQGKYFNIVSDATFFVMSIRYSGHMKYRYHNCLFIVKGNLSLEEIQKGMYQAKDIVSTECSTEYERI